MSTENNIESNIQESWMRHMRRGQFEEAWKVSDRVLESGFGKTCWHLPRHFQYVWTGVPLAGKRVLVRCYHGLGDTIQFVRYMPLVKAIAAEVIVWAQPSLIPLLQTIPGIDRLLPLHDGAPEAEFDVDVEIMELPHVFRTTLETIPNDVPYLHVEPFPLPRDERFAVGIVWQAGDWNENRSVPFHLLTPLAKISDVSIYILQRDAELAGWHKGFGTITGGENPLEDARIMCSLNLLISVDTMTVHLAGALGVPVWNLLYADADWRWMENRKDSPWYPSMRLFRQERRGEWESVVAAVATELEKLSRNYAKRA